MGERSMESWRHAPAASGPQIIVVPLNDGGEDDRANGWALPEPSVAPAPSVAPPPIAAVPAATVIPGLDLFHRPAGGVSGGAAEVSEDTGDGGAAAVGPVGAPTSRRRRAHPAAASRVLALGLSGSAMMGLVAVLGAAGTVTAAASDGPTDGVGEPTAATSPTSTAPRAAGTAPGTAAPTTATAGAPVPTDPTATTLPGADPATTVPVTDPAGSPSPVGGTVASAGASAPAAASAAPSAPAPVAAAPVAPPTTAAPAPPPTVAPTTTAPPPPPEDPVCEASPC